MTRHRASIHHSALDVAGTGGVGVVAAALLSPPDGAPGWHLDDARLVNDAGTAVALLHNANDPGLLALRRPLLAQWATRPMAARLHLGAEAGCLLAGQADQEAP